VLAFKPLKLAEKAPPKLPDVEQVSASTAARKISAPCWPPPLEEKVADGNRSTPEVDEDGEQCAPKGFSVAMASMANLERTKAAIVTRQMA